MESGIALLALLVAGYALAAARLNRLSIGPALFFFVAGAVVGIATGPATLPDPADGPGGTPVEVTLALILFTDASTIDWRRLRAEAGLVVRLLAVGLLLSIAIGTLLAGLLFPELPFGVLLLLGAALAPTDAALGQPVITNRAVPVRIRSLLNAESGLNDGIATPFVVLALSLIASEFGGTGDWLGAAVTEGVIGLLAGAVVGGAGGWLLVVAERSGWTSSLSRQLAVIALAFGAYATSVAFGGNGFIGAFVAGLAFGVGSRRAEEGAEVFTEATGSLLSIVVWLLAGAVFAGPVLDLGIDPRVILYAVLSLTVVRMVPVAIALIGSRLRPETVLFVGWFGPRGLASIVFGLLGLEALRGAGLPSDLVVATIAWTVMLSVVLHGLSAGPLAERYGRRLATAPDGLPEVEERPEPRTRARLDWVPDDRSSAAAHDDER
jgi:NhaP-type Na+/H+ or K+/H+ antiporter